MKTYEDIKVARDVVSAHLASAGYSEAQMALFAGMSVALQWVAEEASKGTTLQRLIDGEETFKRGGQ